MKIFTSFGSSNLAIAVFSLFILGSVSTSVKSQDEAEKPKTRKDCIKLFKDKFSDPIAMPNQAGKELLQLISDLETETDAEKRKLLEAKKKVEMEKFTEKIDKAGNTLCDRLFK